MDLWRLHLNGDVNQQLNLKPKMMEREGSPCLRLSMLLMGCTAISATVLTWFYLKEAGRMQQDFLRHYIAQVSFAVAYSLRTWMVVGSVPAR